MLEIEISVVTVSNVKMMFFITIKNGHKRLVKKRSLQEGKDYLLSFHVMVIYENTEMTETDDGSSLRW